MTDSVVKDIFSKMGNLDPIVDELREQLLSIKTVNVQVLLDFSREWREHIKVSLLMVTGLTLEEAIRKCREYEVRERIRWDPLLNRTSIPEQDAIVERESCFSPEEMANRITEVRYDEDGNDLFEQSYIDEYSETFQIQIPEGIVEDVKKGAFEPEKWTSQINTIGPQTGWPTIPFDHINDDFGIFEIQWQFDTKNRSTLTFKLCISCFTQGLCISIQTEEENKIDDRICDQVYEAIRLQPSDGKPFSISYSTQLIEYEDELKDVVEICDRSSPLAGKWENTYFAKIFF